MHWIALQPRPEALADASTNAQALPADLPTALAWWALQFTPLVAWVDASLVLEVSASERLFGGRTALLQGLFAAQPVALQQAQGATALLALGRLWSAQPEAPIDTLPLHSLAAARAHLSTLQRLGCATWGQLRALPRAGLARRFGAALLEALDRAYGLRPERYPWLRLPDVFAQSLELAAAVEAAPALLFAARRLLAQLLLWLRARQQGVLALELQWQLDARRSNASHVDAHHHGDGRGQLVLRTAQPTQDMAHVQRLLGELLAQVQLPAPVLYLRLRSLQTQALAGESHSLLPDDQRKGGSLHQMQERLAARLGGGQVLCVQPQALHNPQHMQRWLPWAPGPASRPAGAAMLEAQQAVLLPSWLLSEPQPLQTQHDCPQYHGPLTLLAGPQRLESGWLDEAASLRDYYVARSAHAGLLWIYRERLPGTGQKKTSTAPGRCWFLHGLFA